MMRALVVALASSLALLGPRPATAGEPTLAGDPPQGAALFRLHCAGCHGAGARGNGSLAKSLGAPAPADLRDAGMLAQRTDKALFTAIGEGGPAVGRAFTMPAFGEALGVLGTWDVVAFLRQGQPRVGDLFPAATRYSVKVQTIDADGQKRLAPVVADATPTELSVALAAVFGGGERPEEGPALIAQDPRMLDGLKPRQKLGYLAWLTARVPGAGGPIQVALAIDREGVLQAVWLPPGDLAEKESSRIEKLLQGFVGQGGKRGPYAALRPPKTPAKEAGAAQEAAKGLTRAYHLALEAAVMFDKEERERHWAGE